MVDAISSSSTVTGTSALAAQAQEATLNKNDFLQLLIAQLKNQDPLKPQDSTEYVSELAQFSSLEQTMGINERLDALTAQTRAQSTTDALAMVGKTATVGGSSITLPANGSAASISFKLGAAASQTTVTIVDQSGHTVRTLDVGAKPAGPVEVSWDGYDDNGNRASAGTYRVSLDARTADDGAVPVTQETTGRVVSISFENGYPVLQLDSGVSASLDDLVRVDSSATEP